MKTISKFTLGAALLFGAAALSSCSEKDNAMIGSWTSSAPEVVVPTIQGSTSATVVTTFDFSEGSEKSNGPVKMTNDYTVTLPADSLGNAATYTVKASVEGKWTREEKGDDDYYLSFDQNTLDVQGTDAPELGPVTAAFLGSLAQYSKIEDVKVTKDGSMLAFELDKLHTDMTFTRVK